jgi:two-component system sensor histidine kinase RegB
MFAIATAIAGRHRGRELVPSKCKAAFWQGPLWRDFGGRACDMMSQPASSLYDYNCAMNSPRPSLNPGHGQLRRLFALRNVAVAAQLVTLAMAWKILGLALDWAPMLVTVGTLASVNFLTWLRLRSSAAVPNLELFAQLCADVVALTILLYFGGGSTNPFVSLYLLPLVIAAATLPGSYTWAMAAITTACYSLLMAYHVPLQYMHKPGGNAFDIHVFGMWLGFVLSAAIVAYFVVQMAQAVRQRDALLARVREENLRNERIVALGTLAASAAHEMGTPLSTMAVVIGELQHDALGETHPFRDSLGILEEQVRGCKRILDKILASARDGQSPSLRPADQLIAEVLDEWQLLRPTAEFNYHAGSMRPAPLVNADATLRAALMNLLNNAADAGPPPVEIQSRWDSSSFTLQIRDHGDGLSSDAQLKAGSPFFTTKKEGRGLGLFLSNATVERLGGTVRLFNREEGGATTELTLPAGATRT